MSILPLRSETENWFFPGTFEREARLWSGLILMLFVTSHFLNHALGIFGVDVMGAVQEWRSWFWRSWPGTILLYGAVGVHVMLTMRRALSHKTWRIPPLEALQIVLGILIPITLLGHVVGTRVMSSLVDIDDSYAKVLRFIWPDHALMQSIALVIVWGHGIIGLHSAFHVRRWYKSLQAPLGILATTIPLLALAGFVSASREANGVASPEAVMTAAQLVTLATALSYGRTILAALFCLALALIIFNVFRSRLMASLAVRYTGHGEVRAARGMTLLEISRANNIPHPSTCGGRGRCSSCRVLVVEGQDTLEQPNLIEKKMLDRLRASQNVRLACQIRPKADIAVRVLLGSQQMTSGAAGLTDAVEWAAEEELTILFADIRGFASMAQNQLPSDNINLINRVIGEMEQAVEARGGRVTLVQTDGIMAVFGMNNKSRAGSKGAVNAAADILKAVHLVNKDIRAALPLPVRVGIGIHSGQVVMSQTQDTAGGQRYVVIGEAVIAASRLEESTKELMADCVVSTRTLELAGFSPPSSSEKKVHYKSGANPVLVHLFADRGELRSFLGRTSVEPDAEASQR
jgi:adenylate cyclase